MEEAESTAMGSPYGQGDTSSAVISRLAYDFIQMKGRSDSCVLVALDVIPPWSRLDGRCGDDGQTSMISR